MINMYIVSGMSGAGKSQALKIFEDFGFFCVDNMPLRMLKEFANICISSPDKKNVVISIDSRSGEDLLFFKKSLNILKNKGIAYKIIFLNADDSVLLRRYSETRHKHPLAKTSLEGIKLERKAINDIFTLADEVVDTSNLTLGELKKTISIIAGVRQSLNQRLQLSVLSFGYKYGLPNEADIVFDVRFIANPNYVHGLKFKTGKYKPVRQYIEKQRKFKTFFSMFSKLICSTLPGYVEEGKNYLTIAVGCTGGRHRSVFIAEKLAEFIKSKHYNVKLYHRDILQDKLVG